MGTTQLLTPPRRGLDVDRAVLVVNPFAGRARRAALRRIVERLGLPERAVLEVGRDGTVRDIASRAVRDRVPVMLAAGGDGTWHQAIQALAGSPTVLATLPLGTSNDLARHIGVPTDLDVWLATLAHGRAVPLDLLRIGDEYVATVGGLGLPAHVAAACLRLKQGRLRAVAQAMGGAIYSMLTVSQVLRRGAGAVPAVVQCDDGHPQRLPVSALLVGTVARFGGGLELCPAGALTPGRFAALVVTAQTRAGIIDTLSRLRLGRPCGPHARRVVNLERLTIRTRALVGAFGDGEWLGLRHRATIRVAHGAVRVAVPPAASADGGVTEASA